MKKKWLAMLMALVMSVSPAAVQVVDASTNDIETGVTATSPYVDTTADSMESYEYTITGDDGSVAVVEVPAILDEVYKKYEPDFSVEQPIANGTYIIGGGRNDSSVNNINSVVTRTDTVQAEIYKSLEYTNDVNIVDDNVITQELVDSEWEIEYTGVSDSGDKLYTLKAPGEEEYLAIYAATAADGAVTASSNQALIIKNNDNVPDSVAIGGADISSGTTGYLNHRSNSAPGAWTDADIGSAWFLYKLSYRILEDTITTAIAGVGVEVSYTSDSWSTYQAALSTARGLFETSAKAVDAYNALVNAVDGLVEIELPDGITTTMQARYELVSVDSLGDIEAGTYLLLNSRFHRALLAETDTSTGYKYLQVLTQPTDSANETPPAEITLTETQTTYSLDWEISSTDTEGSYYVKNVSTQGYLQITGGQGNVSATLTEDTKVATTISSYTGSEAHTGSVVIGQSGEYLNMHGGSGGDFGGYGTVGDGGAATYLYKKVSAGQIYLADTSELQTLVDTYNAENLQESTYIADTWEAYTAALTEAESLLAASHSFATLGEAVADKEEVDAAYQALANAKAGLVNLKYSMKELYDAICEANGGKFLFSEEVYASESGEAYKEALEAARGTFTTAADKEKALENLVAAVAALGTNMVAEACFPTISWEVTEDANRRTDTTEDGIDDTTLPNYVPNVNYVNTSEIEEGEITFKDYEALTWTWSQISRLVNDEDYRVTPVWSEADNGMRSREFSAGSEGDWTTADVYKISGEFAWPAGYDLHDTTIVLDSVNDFYYRDIYEYISEEKMGDYFPLGQVLPVNDDVYVVMWVGEDDDKPTLPVAATDTTEADDGINNHLAFWSGTSGKGIWSKKDVTLDDWSRVEPATFLEWNLQGERAFRESYPNIIGTGELKAGGSAYTNSDVVSFGTDEIGNYLSHTDGWYTLVDTTAINSVLRSNNPNGIAAGATVHIDLYVMNNDKKGMIDELQIELFKEKETETEVIVNYYLNEVSDNGYLGREVLLNQEYGTSVTLLPGTGAAQLNSYKAEAIYKAGYKEVTDGVQLNNLIVTEGGNNVINVLYTVKNAKIIYLTAPSTEVEYTGEEHLLNTVTVTENGSPDEATLLTSEEYAGKGAYLLPDGNIIYNVYSYVKKTDPGIYANDFTMENGQASPEYVVKQIIDGEETADVTNTYTVIKTPGTLKITYAAPEVTKTYDFGVKNVYADVLEAVELKATLGETGDNVVITDNDVSYTPLAANTGESIDLTLKFAGDYTVTKTLNFIPASNVMYEDGFVTAGEGWTSVAQQSCEVTDNENTVYGYSEAYNNDIALSNGTAMAATLTLENGASTVETAGAATFSFTGTGFDLISECGPNTGMLLVKVTNATEANKAKFYLVDTYFTGDEEYINDTSLSVLDYQVPVIRAMDLPYGEHEVSVWGYLADTTGAGAAVAAYGLNEELAGIGASSRMAVSAEDIVMAALDDLGLSDEVDASDVEVSFIDENSTLNGGTGNVTGSGSAIAMFALTDEESADTAESTTTANVYIDGFRVYGALEDETNYVPKEQGLKYASVYEYALNSAGDLATEENWIVDNSLVYVEYDGAVDVASIAQYQNQGPQNEVYLTGSDEVSHAIGFLLKDYEPEMTVMISAKTVSDGAILGVMDEEYSFSSVTGEEESLSATEMYYDVTDKVLDLSVITENEMEGYMLAFANTGLGVLSISELKLDEAITIADSSDLGTVVVEALEKSNTEAAFVPERFEVSYNDTVRLNKTTSIKVSTSLPVENEPENTVARVELFDTDPTDDQNAESIKEFKFTNKAAVTKGRASYCSFSVSVKVTEDVTYWAVAYNENGEASAPLEITISVQE